MAQPLDTPAILEAYDRWAREGNGEPARLSLESFEAQLFDGFELTPAQRLHHRGPPATFRHQRITDSHRGRLLMTRNTSDTPIQRDVAEATRPVPLPTPLVDGLRDYLTYCGLENLPRTVTSAGSAESRANRPEERAAHPLSHLPRLTDATGAPFTVGGLTESERQAQARRTAEAEEYNRTHASPVPRTAQLQAQ